MSGHSKWSTIKRQKGVADAKRSAIFGKLARQIAVAARDGKDPEMNFKLRLAIDRARASNMPNDNIDRAIRAGSGEDRGQQMKEATYEGFGPGQVAVMVEALTDNPNRTTSELRSLFQKHGGALGSAKSVAWMFQSRGVVRVLLGQLNGIERDEFELGLIDAGATDVREEDDVLVIESDPRSVAAVRDWLNAKSVEVASAGIELLPTTTVTIDTETQQKLFELFEALEEHPDVNQVFSNDV